MRMTLTIDDKLMEEAQRNSGLKAKSATVREALRALIERESARRLALLDGSRAALRLVVRRRSKI